MRDIVEAAWDNRELLDNVKTQETIRNVISLLDKGELTDSVKKTMVSVLNHSTIPSDQSNWSIQKTIIPIDLDLTIDGIGGLKPGNLFRIDYLPELYRKYCYFFISQVGHQGR